MKSLKRMRKNEKEKFVIPKSVQDVIPIKAVYKDGIFLVGNNLYSKTFKFTDINYNIASDEDKQELMKGYWAVINSFGAGVTVKLTINNHQLDRAEFEKSILLRYEYDGLDNYRKEYNDMLLDKAALSNCIVQDKYFTVTVSKKSIDDARAFFNRVGNDLTARLSRIDSKCLPVNAEEKLRTTDKDNPMEIATIDENKKSILLNIFWDMNIIDTKSEERTKTEEVKSTDEHGNEIITVVETKIKVLTITILGKTASEIASQYYFDDEQNKYLDELMSEKNDKLWASIIFNVGNNTSKIDIGSIDFGDETVNDTQKKIVAVATNYQNYGISAGSGYCQAWVADVYQAVTGSRGSAHCALCAADMWAVSSDWSNIPVGATVYGYASNPYGHVGIYIGNGQVIHNLSGTVKVQSLESWIEGFKGFAWGWENGKVLL